MSVFLKFAYTKLDHDDLPHLFSNSGITSEEKYDAYHEIKDWCQDQFGDPGAYPDARWDHAFGRFWFREDADAFWFKVRWY